MLPLWRFSGPRQVGVWSALLLGGLILPAVQAQQKSPAPLAPAPLLVQQVGGSVEVLDRVWSQAAVAKPIALGLRTGTGRALIDLSAGSTLMVGSSSAMRVYAGQADMQTGRFFSSGQAQLYAFGTHLFAQGQVRLDASSSVQRVAIVSGTLRLSPGGRALNLKAGQQYDFKSGKITAFRENDPWYLSRFVGEGSAVVQATRGSVQSGPDKSSYRTAEIGLVLVTGTHLTTAKDAWAEVGFSGGGYLRLQAESELRVLGVEKTDKGREVLLQLDRGSAWNVVQKGAGGYQLSTPTVTTAVRGTVFRVDASGVVKVFEGAVSLPSQGDSVVAQGGQRATGGQTGALKKDALDSFNLTLDAQRASKTIFQVGTVLPMPALDLKIVSNPEAKVTAQVRGAGGEQSVTVSGQNGTFALQQLLAEGRYTLSVQMQRPPQAERLDQTITLQQALVIDQTAPTLAVTAVRLGEATLTVTGTVSDALTSLPLLQAEIGGQIYTLHASGAFSWTLPLAGADLSDLNLSASDDAGNRSYARLP
jgi:FecR protein